MKPERGTKLSFAVGEIVRVQNPKSKQWDATGEIAAVRVASDGKILSYDIHLTDTAIPHGRLKKVYLQLLTEGSCRLELTGILLT